MFSRTLAWKHLGTQWAYNSLVCRILVHWYLLVSDENVAQQI